VNWLVRLFWGVRFKGKSRLFDRLAPRSGTAFGRVFGVRVALDLADYVQRQMYLGSYERAETNRVRRFLRPGMTVVDIGAHAGYFTYLAASRVKPAGRVLAIEPDPVLFTTLAAAVRDNRVANVTLLNIALGRTTGESTLSIPPAAHQNRAPTLTPVAGWEAIRVGIRPLDDVLDECGIGTVDFLKMDVEGFEAEVFAGATRALAAGRIRAVMCEFSDYWLRLHGTSADELWDTLLSHGFRPVEPRPTFSADTWPNCFFTR